MHLIFGHSPDLSPVDYKVWGTMLDRVYQTKVRGMDDLKRRLIEVHVEQSGAKRH